MIVRIQIRRGTATEWTTANPTLSSGEFGYETNTGKLKIGNGATAWNALSYLESGTGGGDSAYVYIAYASDDTGTGFTNTFNPSLDYVAIKSTTSPIVRVHLPKIFG